MRCEVGGVSHPPGEGVRRGVNSRADLWEVWRRRVY
jgi:hypothetical protein